MCLILIANRVHPDFPLIIAANRDEYFSRPTQPARFWASASDVLAGQDLVGGGTWMGITLEGRFAAVTNVRNPNKLPPANALSRGQLISTYLVSKLTPQDFLRLQAHRAAQFDGYNLVCGDRHGLYYDSNRNPGTQRLQPGIHGLSNAGLNSPWPKVDQGKLALEQCIKQENFCGDRLLDVLNDRHRAPDHLLPDTGVGTEMERMLSSRFIEGQTLGYGTRTSTALTVSRSGQVAFIEWTWDQEGVLQDKVEYQFNAQAQQH
ncbi:MAG: NRDE family protein [Ketobacter sp.]